MTRTFRLLAFAFLIAAAGCRKPAILRPDHPRLTPSARMLDFTLDSRILHRSMPVRMVVPTQPAPDAPIVYLLHGAGASYTDWTNQSSIAELADRGIILVMPDAGEGYYVNDATGFRYEDYVLTELIPEVHRRAPYATTARARTAIAGISRGGFGASMLALKHPELFSYVGALSASMDLADRSFRWRAPIESLAYRKVFGKPGSITRTSNDPNRLITHFNAQTAPYFFLLCGDRDTLLPTNQHFAALLQSQNVPHEFHQVPGDHNWSLWSPQIPALEASLLSHFNITPAP